MSLLEINSDPAKKLQPDEMVRPGLSPTLLRPLRYSGGLPGLQRSGLPASG